MGAGRFESIHVINVAPAPNGNIRSIPEFPMTAAAIGLRELILGVDKFHTTLAVSWTMAAALFSYSSW
jgi:hypothetical protein